MKCAVHPEAEASGYCRNCGKPMCPACVRPIRDVLYCEECLAKVMGLGASQAVAPVPVVDATGAPVALPPAATPTDPGAARAATRPRTVPAAHEPIRAGQGRCGWRPW